MEVDLDTLRRVVTSLWSAFRAIESRAVRDASLAVELGLSADERMLAAIDPGYDDATVVSRLDTYFNDRPRVLDITPWTGRVQLTDAMPPSGDA